MKASILAIGTAVPPYQYRQSDIADKFITLQKMNEAQQTLTRKLYSNSAINTRYSVLEDFNKERSQWHFWGVDYPEKIPGIKQRNDLYKQEAPKLAVQACKKALQAWKGDPQDITHVISVSCTGMTAPGIEFDIIQALNLRSSVSRFAINFMGCFGAFKGLAVAKAFAQENQNNRVLVVCTELCSLHFQTDMDLDNLLANSLFSDGSAAVIVGAEPHADEIPIWNIVKSYSEKIDNTYDKMAWNAGDSGFLIKLSSKVPVYVLRHTSAFVKELLGSQLSHSDCDWAIHPGGKSIIQAVEKAMSLNQSQTQSSWDVLAKYGNMSSASLLFVLKKLSELNNQRKWTAGIGFGPGLSVEGILLSKP